jgi:hypothetical protein
MNFPELRAAIDSRLALEPRLQGSRHELLGEQSAWTRDMQCATIVMEGSTGILVEYAVDGRIVHSRVFAMSAMSIERIATTIAEHLTAYAYHRT